MCKHTDVSKYKIIYEGLKKLLLIIFEFKFKNIKDDGFF